MTSITSITSSRDLLALVRQYRPVAEGSELAFDLEPPEGLVPALSVLHTGVRALLVGRPWWGSSDCNAKRAKVAELNPGGPVPDWCGLLCVEGDPRWDRIHPAARVDLPYLFDPLPGGSSSRYGSKRSPL